MSKAMEPLQILRRRLLAIEDQESLDLTQPVVESIFKLEAKLAATEKLRDALDEADTALKMVAGHISPHQTSITVLCVTLSRLSPQRKRRKDEHECP